MGAVRARNQVLWSREPRGSGSPCLRLVSHCSRATTSSSLARASPVGASPSRCGARAIRGTITLVGDEPHAALRPTTALQAGARGQVGLREGDARHRGTAGRARRDAAPRDASRRPRRGRDDRRARRRYLARGHARCARGRRAGSAAGFASSGALATLRSRDDAARLDREFGSLEPDSVVAVIGGGFVGAEVATSVKARGLDAVCLRGAERPLIAVVGQRSRVAAPARSRRRHRGAHEPAPARRRYQ